MAGPIIPEVPVTEVWEWDTDITTTADGTEQRVCLRDPPRRKLRTKFVALDVPEIQEKFRQFLAALNDETKIPYYQYAVQTTVDAGAGSSDLVLDPVYGDLRAEDDVLLVSRTNQQLAKILSVGTTGITLYEPTSIELPAGSVVAPTFLSRIDNRQTIERVAVHDVATVSISSTSVQARALSRPESLVVIPTFEYYPVLEQTPLADSLVETFDTGAELIDFQTGKSTSITNWDFTKVDGERRYRIRRIDQPSEMDWWRDFFAAVKGACKPFLVPTLRPDLSLVDYPADGYQSITLAGTDYATLYWPKDPYKRLFLSTGNGTLCVSVGSVSVSGENSVCHLSASAPSGEGWRSIFGISFLVKCRLASDEVSFEHSERDTIVTLNLKTVPE